MLYGLQDIRMRRQFIEDEDAGPDRKRREHKRLDALLGYCEAPACRRAALLEYFGERIEACGNCDVCLDPSERIDGTEDARKILSAVYRSGERFGAAHGIDFLRGAETEKIARFGHHRVPTFGVGGQRLFRSVQAGVAVARSRHHRDVVWTRPSRSGMFRLAMLGWVWGWRDGRRKG